MMLDEVEAAKNANPTQPGPSIFERIASGEIPSEKIYSDDDIMIIKDIQPVAKKHFLAFLKKNKIHKLSNLKEEQSDLMAKLMLKASQIGNKECPEGFRVIINNGKHGCQSVYHLHIHIIGGEQLGWYHNDNK
ncbi:MAG: hypothetical protein MHPSP_002182 [Paramarteilia canceri]